LLSIDRPEDIPPLAFNSYEDWDLMKAQLQAAEYAASLRPSSSNNKLTRSLPTTNLNGSVDLIPSTPLKSPFDPSSHLPSERISRQNSSISPHGPPPPLALSSRTPILKKQSIPLSPSNSTVSGSINSDDLRQITNQFKQGLNNSPPVTGDRISSAHRRPLSPTHELLHPSLSFTAATATATATAPGGGGGCSVVMSRGGIGTKSLVEKTKDERISKLNLNFSHAQYKLDRIALRVDTNILPRKLRTKLSSVSFHDLSPAVLHLGTEIVIPDDVFNTHGGHLSPLGIVSSSPTFILPKEKLSFSAQLLGKKFMREIQTAAASTSAPTSASPGISSNTSIIGRGRSQRRSSELGKSVGGGGRGRGEGLPSLAKTLPLVSQKSSSSLNEARVMASSRSRSEVDGSDPICRQEVQEEDVTQPIPHRHSPREDEEDTADDYFKTCALCLHRFTAKNLQHKVLLKHIVSLRYETLSLSLCLSLSLSLTPS
jgi:hypothetical protein